MAERRMFAKTIIDSDSFLDMPLTTQALYFHLSMRADDEGFINNPKKILRMIGASEDELKLLIAKSYIIPFESGIVVIKHWKIHNYLRSDRFKPTVFLEEKAQIVEKDNKEYELLPPSSNVGIPSGIPDDNQVVYHLDTQDRLGKDRIGKDRIDITHFDKQNGYVDSFEPTQPEQPPKERIAYKKIQDAYNATCVDLPTCRSLSEARKKAIAARYHSGYSFDDFVTLFKKAQASSFLRGKNNRNWQANFDWLIKDANMAKVLDGNYDDHDAPNYKKSDLDDLF